MYSLKNITYHFLEPQEPEEIAKCVITAHLNNEIFTVDYMLVGIELNPDFMTTDRLFMILEDHYLEREVTDYMDKLDDFVVKFIQDLRNFYERNAKL